MVARIGLVVLMVSLVGCGEYGERFRQAQRDWNNYVNSPDYGARYYTHTVETPSGTMTCDTIIRRYGYPSETRCRQRVMLGALGAPRIHKRGT
jgi:hypothetical protein